MSSEKLIAPKKYINEWLESGRIVPSASPYGYPVLFSEKKGRRILSLCIDYHVLNANIVTDAWQLLHIDDLLFQLKGARVFNSLYLWDVYH